MERRHSIRAIMLGLGLIVAGGALVNVGVPARGVVLGFETGILGALTGLYYLGFAISCFKTPFLVKRAGHIRAFILVSAVLGMCTLGYSIVNSPWMWGLFRIAGGFCMASVYMIVESWVNEAAEDESRGRTLTTYRVVDLGSLIIGQGLIGAFDISGIFIFMTANLVITAGLIPLTITTQVGPSPIQEVTFGWHKILRVSRIAVATAFTGGVAAGCFFGLAPAFASHSNLSLVDIGLFMGIPLAGGVLSQFYVGPMADRMDRERLAAGLTLIAGIGAALLSWQSHNLVSMFLFALLWGGFCFPLYSMAIAIANDRAKSEDFLDISGSLLLVFSFGAVSGPLIVGTMMQYFGDYMLFYIVGAVHIIHATYVMSRRTLVIDAVPSEDREDFQSVPRTTPAIFEMDPRGDV